MQILRLLKQTSLEWYQSRAFELGAALAFYAIFSIAPVIVLAFTAASLVLGTEAAQGRLTEQIESTVGHTVAVAIQATAQYTYQSGSSVPATVLSIVFFGLGAIGLFSQLQIALNAIWEVEPKSGRGLRGNLHDRLGSFLAVLGISALLLADLLVTALLSALGRVVPSSPAPQGFPFWWAVMFTVSWAFLTLDHHPYILGGGTGKLTVGRCISDCMLRVLPIARSPLGDCRRTRQVAPCPSCLQRQSGHKR